MNKIILFKFASLVYFTALVYVVFFLPRRIEFSTYRAEVNGIPFENKVEVYALTQESRIKGEILLDFFGNILLLLPFPIAMYLLMRKKYVWYVWVILIMSASLGIETAQYLFNIGVADIDDVLLNVFGGLIGLLPLHYFKKKFPLYT